MLVHSCTCSNRLVSAHGCQVPGSFLFSQLPLFFMLLNWPFVTFSRTIDRSVFKPIVQIAVIDRSESSDCHLLAVSHAGKVLIAVLHRFKDNTDI